MSFGRVTICSPFSQIHFWILPTLKRGILVAYVMGLYINFVTRGHSLFGFLLIGLAGGMVQREIEKWEVEERKKEITITSSLFFPKT